MNSRKMFEDEFPPVSHLVAERLHVGVKLRERGLGPLPVKLRPKTHFWFQAFPHGVDQRLYICRGEYRGTYLSKSRQKPLAELGIGQ